MSPSKCISIFSDCQVRQHCVGLGMLSLGEGSLCSQQSPGAGLQEAIWWGRAGEFDMLRVHGIRAVCQQ